MNATELTTLISGKSSDDVSFAKAMFYVREMLRDRKYESIPPLEFGKIDFVDRSKNDFVAHKNPDGSGEKSHVLVKYELTSAVANNIQFYIQTNSVEPGERIIVIIKTKINPTAQVTIENLKNLKYRIEIFFEYELQFNLTKHSYVPEHIICNELTKNDVLKKYNVTPAQMIKIQLTDPVVKWIGGKVGQMIKILRPSDFNGVDGKNDKYDISYAIVYENHAKGKGLEKKKTQKKKIV
jgi:DNA-directed RNA polymerase I, II, and III subunit RPABC1